MMSDLWTLIKFEYKKIFQKKSSWIALIVVYLFILLGGVLMEIGSIEAEGEKVSSNYEDMMAQKKEELSYTGEYLDENLFAEAQEAYSHLSIDYVTNAWNSVEDWEDYCTYVRPYQSVAGIFTQTGMDIFSSDVSQFYEYRKTAMQNTYEEENLSEKEINLHFKWDAQTQKPFVYSYTEGYQRFAALQYTNIIFIAFAVAVCVSGIFSGEYTSGVDALILSAKYGKTKEAAAKIFTGGSLAFLVALLYEGSCFLEVGLLYGFEGADAPVQLGTALISYPLTMLQYCLGLLALGILAVCVVAGFTMFCSAKMKSTFPVIILAFILIFVPVMLMVPEEKRILTMLVNLLPARMGGGAFDDRLLCIFGSCVPPYVYVPIVYLALGAFLVWQAGRGFRRHQIGGR